MVCLLSSFGPVVRVAIALNNLSQLLLIRLDVLRGCDYAIEEICLLFLTSIISFRNVGVSSSL